VPLFDGPSELNVLALETIERRTVASHWKEAQLTPDSRRCVFSREGQKKGHVRLEVVDHEQIPRKDSVEIQPAPSALVGERRVEVTLENDILAALEGGANHCVDEL